MSALTRWRRHAHHGIHRVGRDLGIPAKARVPVALGLGLAAACAGYWQYNRPKVGDTVVVDSSAFASIPGVTPGTQVQAKVLSVGAGGALALAPIVAGQQIPVSVNVAPGTKVTNTTPRLFG